MNGMEWMEWMDRKSWFFYSSQAATEKSEQKKVIVEIIA